jgi:hypothetical protein
MQSVGHGNIVDGSLLSSEKGICCAFWLALVKVRTSEWMFGVDVVSGRSVGEVLRGERVVMGGEGWYMKPSKEGQVYLLNLVYEV